MDYKVLMRKYMMAMMELIGDTFVEDELIDDAPVAFSDDERTALEEIDGEAAIEYASLKRGGTP